MSNQEPDTREIASFRQALIDLIDTYTYALATQATVVPSEADIADALLDMYDMRAIQRLIKDVAYEKPEWLSHVSMPARVVDWAMEAP